MLEYIIISFVLPHIIPSETLNEVFDIILAHGRLHHLLVEDAFFQQTQKVLLHGLQLLLLFFHLIQGLLPIILLSFFFLPLRFLLLVRLCVELGNLELRLQISAFESLGRVIGVFVDSVDIVELFFG